MTAMPGEARLAHLFQGGRIGAFAAPNRIEYGACCVSNCNGRDGTITPRELARTRAIASTGCGIIANQGACPDPLGEGKAYFRQVALFDDRLLPQFETIAGYIRDAGAVAIQQILHAGRYGGIDLGYCIQPSVVPQTLPHFRPPREITREQIRQTIAEHADATRRAVRAGFHGTEITSFMGYLLANFNSRFTNRRTDEYGGSTENRGRFMRELIDAIKQATPEHPLVVRLNGAELMDRWGGNDEDECFELMQPAARMGVDMISVTVGWQEAPDSSIGRDIPPGHWNRLAARAKSLLPGVPIAFGVRLPDPVAANDLARRARPRAAARRGRRRARPRPGRRHAFGADAAMVEHLAPGSRVALVDEEAVQPGAGAGATMVVWQCGAQGLHDVAEPFAGAARAVARGAPVVLRPPPPVPGASIAGAGAVTS